MVQLKRIKSESVVQQIIDSLVEAMIRKELRPGDQIPTEMELAESLGVGRNSVREAIKILVYFGVLEIRRAEGTYVCEGGTARDHGGGRYEARDGERGGGRDQKTQDPA